MKHASIKWPFMVLIGLLVCQLSISFTMANPLSGPQTFETWLIEFKQEAALAGIAQNTIDHTLDKVRFLPNIIKLDRAQPEFVTPFATYYHKRVDAKSVKEGRVQLDKYAALLNQTERTYGVPKAVLVAFWGLETSYGQFKGNVDTFSALATLAYEGRRAAFFKQQLLDALRIAQHHPVQASQLKGSWAGAFGHMQFMPSTFQAYATDGDNDGVIDLHRSLADAFASAGHYLAKVGWQKALPIASEITLPKDFLWQTAQLGNKKTIAAWQKLGIKPDQALQDIATKFPNTQTAIVLPQGAGGPAFMVFDNFDVVMDWNRSVFYALSVAALSTQLQTNGDVNINNIVPHTAAALSYQEMQQLQQLLNLHGFDAGVPDGFPGVQTQAAIRAFQLTQQLPADGYASLDILQRLKREIH